MVLLVDKGQLAPSATYTDNAIWGYTLGGGYVVPRSGIGVTADGALVYVAGPALTAKSLAESLQRAGAVRAMTLDINPEWVTFNFYSHAPGRSPAAQRDQALPRDAAAGRPLPAARMGGTRLLRGPAARGQDRSDLMAPSDLLGLLNPTSFVTTSGYLAIFVLSVLQSCCVPTSSELILGFAGVLAAEGKLSLPGAIAAGALGEVVGAYIAWFIGRPGARLRRPVRPLPPAESPRPRPGRGLVPPP